MKTAWSTHTRLCTYRQHATGLRLLISKQVPAGAGPVSSQGSAFVHACNFVNSEITLLQGSTL